MTLLISSYRGNVVNSLLLFWDACVLVFFCPMTFPTSQHPRLVTQVEPSQYEKLLFECDGEAAARVCMKAVNDCIEQSEAAMWNLYNEDPRLATESRPSKVCSCFRSNGCKPSCNVQMYVLWVTESKMQCPAVPPSYVESSGVFNYGDQGASVALPSDLSYEYFPQYPNPSNHRYFGPVPDYEYRMPEFYNHRWEIGHSPSTQNDVSHLSADSQN